MEGSIGVDDLEEENRFYNLRDIHIQLIDISHLESSISKAAICLKGDPQYDPQDLKIRI